MFSRHNLSVPFKNTDKVAKASPKSLIPFGLLNPKFEAIPNKCRARIKAANLVKMPSNNKDQNINSEVELAKITVLAEIPIFTINSGTNPVHLSTAVN